MQHDGVFPVYISCIQVISRKPGNNMALCRVSARYLPRSHHSRKAVPLKSHARKCTRTWSERRLSYLVAITERVLRGCYRDVRGNLPVSTT